MIKIKNLIRMLCQVAKKNKENQQLGNSKEMN